MQPNLHVQHTDELSNKNKNKPPCFIQTHDNCHNTATDKTYLAVESDRKKTVRKDSNDSMIMLDIFGALNY